MWHGEVDPDTCDTIYWSNLDKMTIGRSSVKILMENLMVGLICHKPKT
jgi:hypothetical protein